MLLGNLNQMPILNYWNDQITVKQIFVYVPMVRNILIMIGLLRIVGLVDRKEYMRSVYNRSTKQSFCVKFVKL